MGMFKLCSACGNQKAVEKFGKGRAKCKPCRSALEGARYHAKRAGLDSRKSAEVHQYGTEVLPPGFAITGVSQMVDADGKTKIQWIKSAADKTAQREILMNALREMAENFRGIVEPIPLPDHCEEDLCVVMPIGDLHVGMHAWGEETGQDFNLKICKENMISAVHDLFKSAPKAKQCVIIDLGDYYHADSAANTTTKGTPVDVDGRRVKVVRTGLEIFANTIQEALRHFEDVHVICVKGNHDGESSEMLALMLDLMFSEEKRVTIETAPRKFHKFVWGKCLLATTHGDTGKDSELPMIMATDWKADWSSCEYYRWYKGHVHHDSMKEYTGGVIVETHRTLTPSDSWHKSQGYRSGQSLKIDVWSKEWGHVQRNEVGIRRVHALNEKRRKKKE